MLQDTFEQAEWRQPSVVLLDDLDYLTGAPTSAEHEHGPEAVLQQHIAQSKSLTLHAVFVCWCAMSIPGRDAAPSGLFCGCRSEGHCGRDGDLLQPGVSDHHQPQRALPPPLADGGAGVPPDPGLHTNPAA